MEPTIIFFKGMPLFQKAVFKNSFTLEGELKEVACFFYMSKGKMESYDSRGLHQVKTNNAVLKNCGRYVQNFQPKDNDTCIAIAVFLYPDLLKEIYKHDVPSFFKVEKPTPKNYIGNKLIEQYMKNLSLFFEEPDTC